MKKFFEEFKAFISKGDVVSMAVGLMVGSAFTAIITALNTNILTPLLGIIIGGIDFSKIIFQVGSAKIEVGLFIQAVINFLITAFVLFLVVKFFNSFKKKEEEKPAAPPAVPEDVKLLTEIRDLLKNQK
ncbi:MAG: large conductance mechanosensitive channel protein MscL [Lachnospiraceae bacterium]|nr:large conductance mechanosensitive channel protein MscL [Lachnospiraceae bacterium]